MCQLVEQPSGYFFFKLPIQDDRCVGPRARANTNPDPARTQRHSRTPAHNIDAAGYPIPICSSTTSAYVLSRSAKRFASSNASAI